MTVVSTLLAGAAPLSRAYEEIREENKLACPLSRAYGLSPNDNHARQPNYVTHVIVYW